MSIYMSRAASISAARATHRALALGVVAAFAAFTAASTPAAAVTGAELVESAGIDAALRPIRGGIVNQFQQSGAPIAPEDVAGAADAFAPEPMIAGVAARLDEALSVETRAAVHAFYTSPLGLRMVTLEGAAADVMNDPEGPAKIAGMQDVLDADPARAGILADMAAAIQADVVNDVMLRGIMRSMMAGMAGSAAAGAGGAMDRDQLDALVEQQITAIKPMIQEQERLQWAYTYRDASMDDLESYLAFLTTEDGRLFYGAAAAALVEQIDRASYEFGVRIGALPERQDL